MSQGAVDALIGKKCGNYALQHVLGSGGMGTVYAAVQPTLGKRVAIKVLRPELAGDRKAVGRLIDEARATTAIGHRNIVEVFDIGETADGLTYLAMEILEDHFDAFVAAQVQSGRYANATDVIRSGLRLLEERETRLEALRRALVEGEASGVAGPLDLDEIKKRAREDAGLSSS